MYLGRYQLGETVGLLLQTKNAVQTPTVPDNPPQAVIWKPDGTKYLSKEMPVIDRYSQTGLFLLPLFLGLGHVTGHYRVTYTYYITATTYHGLEEDAFEVVAGGHTDGRVIAAHFLVKPDRTVIVQQYDSGRVKAGRNPKIV
jgi:hypothetical protein